jgi:hypothetical protein
LALRDLPGQTLVAALLKNVLDVGAERGDPKDDDEGDQLTMMAYSTAVAPRSLRRPAILT